MPEPQRWWPQDNGGLATVTAPVLSPSVTLNTTHNHHYYGPAVPAAPPRFSLRRLLRGRNIAPAIGSFVLVVATRHYLEADRFVIVYITAGVAALGELIALMKHQYSGWLIRLLSFAVVEACVITAAGRHAISYIVTGV